MDIFISWSKERSKAIAGALNKWLPHVIQRSVHPWMSAADIDPGERWNEKVAEQLEKSQVGIICLTPENLNNPWILFEAGAISKKLGKVFVCPYLHELNAQEVTGPLSQFQSATADKEGTRALLHTINKALGNDALDREILDNSFKKWWPDLKREFKKISDLELETDRAIQNTLKRTSDVLTVLMGNRRSPIDTF